MPEVSVIIPNYNHAPYLKQRIDSIIQQTFQDIEVIILDDCSTDNSIEIIEEYSHHPKVSKIVFNDQNSGSTFIQWEKGIGLARGKWIWIAESDDWCEKTFLETFIPAFDDSKNCSIAFCQTHAVGSDGKIILTSNNPVLEEVLAGTEFINSRMLHMNSIFNASMCIFQRKFYYQISNKYTKYKFCGDWLFWIEIAARGNVYISAKILNYFRKHKGDVSTNAFKSGLYYLEYLKLTDDLEEMNFIGSNAKKKLIEASFKKYYLDNPADKNIEIKLSKRYHQDLGVKYYLISAASFYKKMKNRVFLISLAVKRRLNAGQHV
jgi:glycosyltransferase involved in cell wall biosynthesis